MKTPTIRNLTIEDFNPNGRFGCSSATLLRLKGCWLYDAGFHAGDRVMIKSISPGVIEVRICSSVPVDPTFVNAINRLNAVLNENPEPPGTAGSL